MTSKAFERWVFSEVSPFLADWHVAGYATGFTFVHVVGVVVGGLAECWKFGVVTADGGGFYSWGVWMFLVAG